MKQKFSKLKSLLLASALLPALAAAGAQAETAQTAPAAIKIGTLYAGSGHFASISMPVYDSLKLWVDQVNAEGGVFVKAYNKKIPVKLIAYDDQSSTATAATLYNQLITQDHVNILVSDSGSVLTSVAVPIAKEHKMFLFAPSGSGRTFFTKDNPYIGLMAVPVSSVWPKYLADYLDDVASKEGVKTLAMLYSTNDFTGGQADALRDYLKKAGKIKIVYDHGVPTSTSNYTVLINNIAAQNPDAVVEFGYPGNDIAFLRNLQDSGESFRFLFSVFAGQEFDLMKKNVGLDAMKNVFSYVPASAYAYKVNYGMNLEQYKAAWDKKYPKGSGVEFGANAIYGYQTGLVIERALATAEGLDQLQLRAAVFAQSGKLETLDGPFELNDEGAQIGVITPLGQLQSEGKELTLKTVYPPKYANAKAVLGK